MKNDKTINTNIMKAIQILGYGSHEVLKITEVKKPKAKENEVLVQIHASSATRADVMMISGKPFFTRLFIGLKKPKQSIPGTGFAGVVVSVGENRDKKY